MGTRRQIAPGCWAVLDSLGRLRVIRLVSNLRESRDPKLTTAAFFEHYGQRAPAQAPFSSQTVYSNIAFPILSFAVEAVTKRPFAEFVANEIWKPSHMTRSFTTKPDDALGFIPAKDIWWDANLGFEGP